MVKINLNPNCELFRWGPIDSVLLFVDYFDATFSIFAKRFPGWPDMVELWQDKQMVVTIEYPKLRTQGAKIFQQFIMNDQKFRRYRREWESTIQWFQQFYRELDSINFRRLSDQELAAHYTTFHNKLIEFWVIGFLPELANWGGEEILKNELISRVPVKDFPTVFEQLAAPDQLSFYQREEFELLRLRSLRGTALAAALAVHQQKHFHILNSYAQTKVLGMPHFRKALARLTVTAARRRVNELAGLRQHIIKRKSELVRKYRLGPRIAKISDRLAYCVWWQDERKYYIFLANHWIAKFAKQAELRFSVSRDDLHYYQASEFKRLIEKGSKVPLKEIGSRQKGYLYYYDSKANSNHYATGSTFAKVAKQFWKPVYRGNADSIRGIVVSSGQPVRGRVRVILGAKQINTMRKGEVLVTSMTSPDFIVAMRKAAAIVTDEGGMTSHAAIVSRELGIPCIVGTKHATQIFKDGDRVEVDATKGVARKL